MSSLSSTENLSLTYIKEVINMICTSSPKAANEIEKSLDIVLVLQKDISSPVNHIYYSDVMEANEKHLKSFEFKEFSQKQKRLIIYLDESVQLNNEDMLREFGHKPEIIAANPANLQQQLFYYSYKIKSCEVKFGFDLLNDKRLTNIIINYYK